MEKFMIVPRIRAIRPGTIIWVLTVMFLTATLLTADNVQGPAVLNPTSFKHYVDTFNENDDELYIQHIPNEKSWEFLKANIPLCQL